MILVGAEGGQLRQDLRHLAVVEPGGGQPAVIQDVHRLVAAVRALDGHGLLVVHLPLRHRRVAVVGVGGVFVVFLLQGVQLGSQLIQLLLQRLLVLGLFQVLQLVLGGGQILVPPVVLDLRLLHGGLGQRGVVADELVALAHRVALGYPDFVDGLAGGEEHLLYLIRCHHAAGVGRVAPVVGHAEIVDGVHVHVTALGVPGDGQSAPHRAAHAHHAGGGDDALFQLFAHAGLFAAGALFTDMQLFPQVQLLTHSRHLPTARRPEWSSAWRRAWRWNGHG